MKEGKRWVDLKVQVLVSLSLGVDVRDALFLMHSFDAVYLMRFL